jgi:hypothetical protein
MLVRSGMEGLHMRPSVVLSIFLLVMWHAPPASSQTRPGFWEVSAQAAADAGLDSTVAPIILANALDLAIKYDKEGMRPVLSQLQLMLAYVAANRFDLYIEQFGSADLKLDVASSDLGLKDYLPTLQSLQSTYYERWLSPRPDETEHVRYEALAYAAEKLAKIELAIRTKIAADDALPFADALERMGLVFRHLGDREQAVSDYEEALGIYADVRRGLTAMANADQAFRTDSNWQERNSPNESMNNVPVDNMTLSSAEPYIFSAIVIASLKDLDDAIKAGDLAKANSIISILNRAELEGRSIALGMDTHWPCHEDNSGYHSVRAWISQRQMQIDASAVGMSSPAAKRDFEQADEEYRTGLEIELFSNGVGEQLTNMAQYYLIFLKEAGHDEEAISTEERLKSLNTASIGTDGPDAWKSALDCERLSR